MQKNENRPGYHKTKIGWIPEEWNSAHLGELFNITSSKRVYQNEWKSEGIPFYRAREIIELCSKGHVNNELNISCELYEKYKRKYGVPCIGDLLITGVGTIGIVHRVQDNKKFYFKDGNIIWLRHKGIASSEFIKHTFSTREVRRQVIGISPITTVATYTIIAAKKTAVYFPSILEQEAIAGVLECWDRAIQKYEEKIEKKKNIKKGLMQRLLSGKQRLPGFSGEWTKHTFGELFHIGSSKRVYQREWKEEGIPFYRAREVVKLCEQGFVQNELFISRELYNEYRKKYGVPQKDDLLVTGVGTIGKVFRVQDDSKMYFKDGNIIWFKSKKLASSEYIEHVFRTRFIRRQILGQSPITTVATYTIESAKQTSIVLPPLSEQRDIAAVLSSANSEIKALEKKLAVLRGQKKYLLNNLVTGTIRLPEFNAVEQHFQNEIC